MADYLTREDRLKEVTDKLEKVLASCFKADVMPIIWRLWLNFIITATAIFS